MWRITDLAVHTLVERSNQKSHLGSAWLLNGMSVVRTSEGSEFNPDLELKHF